MIDTNETAEKPPWEDRFLALVSDTGNVTKAAKGARVGRKTVYQHRRERPDFARRWEEAEELGAAALEDEARRRAFDGSDTLMIFLLKAHFPEKYREIVQHQHGGSDGGPLTIRFVNDWRTGILHESEILEAPPGDPLALPASGTASGPVE